MTRVRLCCSGIIAVTALVASASAGDLDPPAGPIAPTHKTLTQVEPRTPISATTTPGDGDSVFRISQSGSYYLTGNITGVSGRSGIEVAASNVTIDLNGFAMTGVVGSLAGIRSTIASTGWTIRDGVITGWGSDGISAPSVSQVSVSGVNSNLNAAHGMSLGVAARLNSCGALGNGTTGYSLSAGAIVQGCSAQQNGTGGFNITESSSGANSSLSGCVSRLNGQAGFEIYSNAAMDNCVAAENTDEGIVVGSGATIRGCVVYDNGGTGIDTDYNTPPAAISGGQLVITDCAVRSNGGEGINARTGQSVITGCNVNFNTSNGIRVGGSSLVARNFCGNNGSGGDGAGILAVGSDCRIENNNATSNDRGIETSTSGNIIFGNTASGNTSNYEIAAGNRVGVIVSATSSAAISGATGGSGLGSTDPWSNFSY